MNYFFPEPIVYLEYKPIDITQEPYLSRRKTQPLYKFNKTNPFDESINWKELNWHYKNGTLDYDYPLPEKYRASRNLKSENPEIKPPSADETETLCNTDSADTKVPPTAPEEEVLDTEKDCDEKPCDDGDNITIESPRRRWPSFDSKLKKLSKWKRSSKPEHKKKKRNYFSSYKKTFYTTTALTALLSTGALVGTVALFPPLAPILACYLLPLSVISNGILLFKAKKAFKKRKTNNNDDLFKFKIKSSIKSFSNLFSPMK